MSQDYWAKLVTFLHRREVRNGLLWGATCLATLTTCYVALHRIGPDSPTRIGPAIGWAAWAATALATGLASLRVLGGGLGVGRAADNAIATIARVWLAAFATILITVEASTAIRSVNSLQQQRLCANAARVLRFTPDKLREAGLQCDRPHQAG